MRQQTSFLPLPAGFSLTQAVCSYGFFVLSPNKWRPQGESTQPAFERPLQLDRERRARFELTQPVGNTLKLSATDGEALTPAGWSHVHLQVKRMLRLHQKDCEDVAAFQKLSSAAAQQNFGRLFRSPDIWEDLVKSILLCNCGWGRTVAMNAALVEHVGKGGFPTAAETAAYGAERLQADCGLGYRARTISKLAQQVVAGEMQLEAFEAGHSPTTTWQDAEKEVRKAAGMGPFTAANMLQLMGHYAHIPCDSETMRHLKKHHGLTACAQGQLQEKAQQAYAAFAPYQFLAYWHELWMDYEARFGSFANMKAEDYALITGHNMRQSKEGLQPPQLIRIQLQGLLVVAKILVSHHWQMVAQEADNTRPSTGKDVAKSKLRIMSMD
ncbi:hypothetical protein WJX84_009298 [Apatococcus fuscideae]|uniref:Uncharacterized protein n=1 Tax=Apatococcus fuscideae TaxID=2026836 RepID=A0AAW1T0J9_9CHLO